MSELIAVQDLKMHYPIGRRVLPWRHPTRVIRAVDDVSFHIRQGETFALVGESGSGKSTIGRLLLRLIEPTAGRIWFRGQDILALHEAQLRSLRRHVQLIFQDPAGALNPRMRVGTLLEEPFICHREGDRASRSREIERLLGLVGLDASHRHRYPHELSGGQRQRVCIARALALRPSFIVCDEPISALDASYQAQIINLLSGLQEELDLTYLFISHDLRVVRHMANRVAVMYLGKLVELAQVEELFERPLHPYTRALIAASPAMQPRKGARRRAARPQESPDPSAPPSGCRFRTRCPLARRICEEVEPPLASTAGGRQVACHFAGENEID